MQGRVRGPRGQLIARSLLLSVAACKATVYASDTE